MASALQALRAATGRRGPHDTVPYQVVPGAMTTQSREVAPPVGGRAALLAPGEFINDRQTTSRLLAPMAEEFRRTGKVDGKKPTPTFRRYLASILAADERERPGENEAGEMEGYARGGLVPASFSDQMRSLEPELRQMAARNPANPIEYSPPSPPAKPALELVPKGAESVGNGIPYSRPVTPLDATTDLGASPNTSPQPPAGHSDPRVNRAAAAEPLGGGKPPPKVDPLGEMAKRSMETEVVRGGGGFRDPRIASPKAVGAGLGVRALSGLGAALYSQDVGAGSDVVPGRDAWLASPERHNAVLRNRSGAAAPAAAPQQSAQPESFGPSAPAGLLRGTASGAAFANEGNPFDLSTRQETRGYRQGAGDTVMRADGRPMGGSFAALGSVTDAATGQKAVATPSGVATYDPSGAMRYSSPMTQAADAAAAREGFGDAAGYMAALPALRQAQAEAAQRPEAPSRWALDTAAWNASHGSNRGADKARLQGLLGQRQVADDYLRQQWQNAGAIGVQALRTQGDMAQTASARAYHEAVGRRADTEARLMQQAAAGDAKAQAALHGGRQEAGGQFHMIPDPDWRPPVDKNGNPDMLAVQPKIPVMVDPRTGQMKRLQLGDGGGAGGVLASPQAAAIKAAYQAGKLSKAEASARLAQLVGQ